MHRGEYHTLTNEGRAKPSLPSAGRQMLPFPAYLEERGSEFGNHGWVNPYAFLHDGCETVKRDT